MLWCACTSSIHQFSTTKIRTNNNVQANTILSIIVQTPYHIMMYKHNTILPYLDLVQTRYSEGGYGINIQVEKSKNMTIVKFMECDLNQLF